MCEGEREVWVGVRRHEGCEQCVRACGMCVGVIGCVVAYLCWMKHDIVHSEVTVYNTQRLLPVWHVARQPTHETLHGWAGGFPLRYSSLVIVGPDGHLTLRIVT